MDKKKIRVVFSNDDLRIFDANVIEIKEDGLCYLYHVEDNNEKAIGIISILEIRYLEFIEVEEWEQR